jgi:hypothetical protein
MCVLVKAYPQPSQQYNETVCCAAITTSGELIRLYPIPFRLLRGDQQFFRYDWIEAESWKAESDPRPESYKVEPHSIEIVKKASRTTPEKNVALWAPLVSPSYEQLLQDNQQRSRSLGIVKPDEGTVRFLITKATKSDEEHIDLAKSMLQQMSLLYQEPLRELKTPEYVFSYQFECEGKRHKMKIHDWEVAATYHNYKREYGRDALDRMHEVYEEKIPSSNMHIVLGTMQKRPYQFIIIGILRSKVAPELATAQQQLF